MPAEIIREWAGYNGQTTVETNPDGSVKKETKHHKIWAAALTRTGHIYVRYGSARHPLKLTEQIIRPYRGVSEREALAIAESMFDKKVREKRYLKRYDTIPFDAPPHHVPSFSKWRMSDEPEEAVAPTDEMVAPEAAGEPLRTMLEGLRSTWRHEQVCMQCGMQHPRFLIDLRDGWIYAAEALISLLSRTEQGATWLAVPCFRKGQALLHAETHDLLATLIDVPSDGSLTEGWLGCVFRREGIIMPYPSKEKDSDGNESVR